MSETPRGEEPENKSRLEKPEPVFEQSEQGKANMPDWLKRDIEQREKREVAEARIKIEKEMGGEISPELRKDLLEAAKLSNTPENLAMMTPELRAMLENVRKNHRRYFYGSANSAEGPERTSGEQITSNSIGIEHGLNWRNFDFVHFGKARRPIDFKFVFDKTPSRGEPVERLGLSPTDEQMWALTYKYSSYEMTESMGRPGGAMGIGLALPENEARQVYAQMKAHPEYAREFFVCAALDTEGDFPKIILGAKGQGSTRKVDWEKTDNQRKITFMEFDGEKYDFHQMEPGAGKWKETALPEKLSQHQIMWNNDLEQRRQRAKTPVKKPGLFSRIINYVKENWD